MAILKGIQWALPWGKIRSLHPATQYCLALAATIVAYGLYALLVAPVLEGGSLVQASPGPKTPPPATPPISPDLVDLLPPGSWELSSCKSLETSQGTIYFRDYQPLENGILEVFPFTMVLNSESKPGSGSHPPVILRASKRAELQFERRVTLTGNPGRIVGGQLQGTVQLLQAPKAGNPSSGFQVWTQNVQLTASRVTTLEAVEFQFGPHHGSGRHLTIELAHETPLEAINNDFSRIRGVKRLELAFVDRLQIELNKVDDGTTGPLPRSTSNTPGKLDVSCQGNFVFDFDALEATFDDHVVVRQINGQGDSLTADQLRLRFLSHEGFQAGTNEAPASEGLQLRSLEAIGKPAQVRLESRDVSVAGEQLSYDLLTRQIRGRDSRFVEVRQRTQLIRAPQLDYRVRDDGSIGTLLARGPGSFSRNTISPDGKEKLTNICWQEQLSIEQLTGGKLIALQGGAEVRLDDSTRISGDDLKLLLSETRLNEKVDQQAEWDYQPQELLVTGNVQIETSQVQGKSSKLTARWFNQTELTPIGPRTEWTPQPKPLRETAYYVKQESTVDSTRGFPAMDAPRQPDDKRKWQTQVIPTPSNDDRATKKLAFEGQELVASLQQSNGQTQIRQLDVLGNVNVQERSIENAPAKFTITGDRLTIVPQDADLHGNDLYRISIFGQARVLTPELDLTGPELQLDQTANRMWTNGAGAANMVPHKSTPATDQVQSEKQIEIVWEGGMIFDGEKVYFEGDVRSKITESKPDGERTVLTTNSQGLNLVLNRPISLRELDAVSQAEQSEFELTQIVLVDQIPNQGRAFTVSNPSTSQPVQLERVIFDASGEPTGKERVEVPRVVMDVVTGDVSAQGPGELIQWRPRNKSPSDKRSFLSSPDNDAALPGKSLAYLHCRFDGKFLANTQRTELRIGGRVRTLYAGAANWIDTLDPDATRLPLGATRINCEQIQVTQWTLRGADQPTSEILATDNVRITNPSFEATAERLSYNEQSDLLVIEGGSQQDANLWFQPKATNKRDHLVAGKILYRPSDQWTQIERVRNATLNQGR